MKTIKLAPNLELPLDTAVVQRYAAVGKVGSGKSNTMMRLIEQFLEHQVQTVIIDPPGIWWSLRASKNNAAKPSGLNINVIGGKNGDIQIDPEKAALYADWIVEKGASAVFDLKFIRPGKREEFVANFLRQLYYKKGAAHQRTPLHLVLEEAQRYAPQNPDGRDDKMSLSVIKEIAEVGRNDGFGISLVTPAPQAVHKRVLNLTECLFVHQTNGTHERKALLDWAVNKHLTLDHTDLTTLSIGEAYVWSPTWLGIFDKYKILRKTTYDASSTLKFGESTSNVSPPLPEKALAELRSSLAEATKHVEEQDPKRLQQRIRELERQLAERPALPQRLEVEVVGKDTLKALERTAGDLSKLARGLIGVNETTGKRLHSAETVISELCSVLKRLDPTTIKAPMPAASVTRHVPSPEDGNGKLAPMQRAILTTLAQHGPCDSRKLTLLAGYAYSGGFQNALGALRSHGWIEGKNTETMRITQAGMHTLGSYTPLPTGEALRQYWLNKLSSPMERKILEALFANPSGLNRQSLCEITGYAWSGGFQNVLGRLRTANVLVGRNSETMRVAEELLG